MDEKYTPICLPDKAVTNIRDEYGGRMATATGWGMLGNGQQASVLQEIHEKLPITKGECPLDEMMSDEEISDKFCNGRKGVKKQTCAGDSGGPISLKVCMFLAKTNLISRRFFNNHRNDCR